MVTALKLEETQSAPEYLEAYPVLDIFEARAAAVRGDLICRYLDEGRRTIGGVFIKSIGDLLVFQYQFAARYIQSTTGTGRIRTRASLNGIGRNLTQMICPCCDREIRKLVYANRWACRRCLKLKNRSTLVSKGTVSTERWNQLQALLRSSNLHRPHGTHQRTFRRLVDTLEELTRQLKDQPGKVASQKHRYVVTTMWEAPTPGFVSDDPDVRIDALEWVLYSRSYRVD